MRPCLLVFIFSRGGLIANLLIKIRKIALCKSVLPLCACFNPPASASTQHPWVSQGVPSDPWVHPTTLATELGDRARTRSAHTWHHPEERWSRTNHPSTCLRLQEGCHGTRPSTSVRPLPPRSFICRQCPWSQVTSVDGSWDSQGQWVRLHSWPSFGLLVLIAQTGSV